MAQRRTRHRFNTAQGAIDVLAYSEQRAMQLVQLHGYTGVEKVSATRKHVPASQATWRKREGAIREAIASLDITRPVTIKLTGHAGGRRGGYRPTNDGTGHHITIKNYLDPDRAGRTLWHELAHAMQFEREVGEVTGATALARWAASDARKGSYRSRLCEVEARSYEVRNEALPLAAPR